MDSLPSLPSTAGNTAYSTSPSVGELEKPDKETNETTAANGPSSTDEGSATSSQLDELLIVERLNQEIEDLRSAWSDERVRYKNATLELNRLQTIVEACNASYRCIEYYHGTVPQASLEDITIAIIEKWAHSKEKAELDRLNDVIKQRETNIKNHCRHFFQANRTFSDVASEFYKEIEKYSMWTIASGSKLRLDYAKYCQIMKTQGLEPESLYEKDQQLERMQRDFYAAWDARKAALTKAMEMAHLDGHPDMLDNLFGI